MRSGHTGSGQKGVTGVSRNSAAPNIYSWRWDLGLFNNFDSFAYWITDVEIGTRKIA